MRITDPISRPQALVVLPPQWEYRTCSTVLDFILLTRSCRRANTSSGPRSRRGSSTRALQIKSIGVPFCHPMAKGISIGRSFCHILCHIAILRAKCAQDSQKDSYSHPLCQRRGPIERRATASLERASSELFWLPYHRPSVRGLRTIQGHHLYWKVLCESSERYGPSEGGEQLDLHI